jgi:hypothetical protein
MLKIVWSLNIKNKNKKDFSLNFKTLPSLENLEFELSSLEVRFHIS